MSIKHKNVIFSNKYFVSIFIFFRFENINVLETLFFLIKQKKNLNMFLTINLDNIKKRNIFIIYIYLFIIPQFFFSRIILLYGKFQKCLNHIISAFFIIRRYFFSKIILYSNAVVHTICIYQIRSWTFCTRNRVQQYHIYSVPTIIQLTSIHIILYIIVPIV